MRRTVDNFLKRYCEEKVVVKVKSAVEEYVEECNKTISSQKDFKSRINKSK